MKKRIALFLDKDGTLIKNVPYSVDPKKIVLIPGAGKALRLIQTAGYVPVIVTNQSGIARGFFSEKDLQPVKNTIKKLLKKNGVNLEGFYFCPHHPRGNVSPYNIECPCRKPNPGLLTKAAAELGIDLGNSWMVGDMASDIKAGKRAGCKTILLSLFSNKKNEEATKSKPLFVAKNFNEVISIILKPALL